MKGMRIGAALLAAATVAWVAATAQAEGPATGQSYTVNGKLSGYVQATSTKPGSIMITVSPSTSGRVVTPGWSATVVLTRATAVFTHHKIKNGDPGSIVLQYHSLSAPVLAVYDLG
jgi:hypothetical protein